ncbi:MAG: DUF4105 domain-containing protein [Hyphomonadaceae bacterium]|nr:DUF4105 domain-containing protein [Hyphomonadaceae bacterium]
MGVWRMLTNWTWAHPMRLAIGVALAASLVGCATFSEPRADRDWYPYLGRTSHVEMADDAVTISPVSDWTYTAQGERTRDYVERSFNISDVRNVWFMLEPQPGSQLAAHTLLLFELPNDRLIGVTIEARREQGEEYSALRGVFNAFELSYLWAEARDLLTRRATMLDHEIFVYPVDISDAQKQILLRRMLQRTDALEAEPRFYNTIFSNCTNELAKAAGFNWAPAYILTGTSDEYLFNRGIIPGASFVDAHARSDVTQWVKAHNDLSAEAFDAALLTELRARLAS